MVEPQTNVSLASCNTLRLPARSRLFARLTERDQLAPLIDLARRRGLPLLLLGGGSNVVFSADFDGLCVQLATRGIRLLADDGDSLLVRVEAGEEWHRFVEHCLDNGWHGLENLALIPGTVGAAPIQNIGAYGVEVRDCIELVELCYLDSGVIDELPGDRCGFGYRDSLFKGELRDRVVILSVCFRLQRRPHLQLGYRALADALADLAAPQPRDLFERVVALRQAKLPDPAVLPNAGSFFKNPVVSDSVYQRLRLQHPELVAYPEGDRVKLAAGWLIERAGWKGYRCGPVGVHRHQALVLVHYGGGSGSELLELAHRIQADIQQRFGVTLEIEPRIY